MIERFSIPSLNNEKRGIQVYLPRCYERLNKKYPVVYMHDGLNVFRDEDAIGGLSLGLETYLDAHSVEIIVAAIDANPADRVNEYCPWVYGEFSKRILGDAPPAGGKGGQYVDFVVHQLKPLIDERHRMVQNEAYMAGISLGGLITTYAISRFPKVFTRAAVMSSAYYPNQEQIEGYLRTSDLSGIQKFYLDCGTNEAGENELINREFVSSNRSVYEILQSKIPNIRFDVVDQSSHRYSDFRKRIPEMFKFMLSVN